MHANVHRYGWLHFAIRNFQQFRISAEIIWRLMMHMSVLVRRIQAPRHRRQNSHLEELGIPVRCRLLSAHLLLHKLDT